MRILLVEDDEIIAESLAFMLKEAAYATDTALDGERGYFLAVTNPYDLIILDYNLPLLSGREIIAKLRTEGIGTPILMLTVSDTSSDKIDILNLGADDYLTKPFALSELLARIRAILRRPANYENPILSCGALRLDFDRCRVTAGRRHLDLSTKEFSLLAFLLQNKGRIVSRREITEHVWDENANPFSNTIEVHIKNIRKKMGSSRKMIYTFPNRGYKLDVRK